MGDAEIAQKPGTLAVAFDQYFVDGKLFAIGRKRVIKPALRLENITNPLMARREVVFSFVAGVLRDQHSASGKALLVSAQGVAGPALRHERVADHQIGIPLVDQRGYMILIFRKQHLADRNALPVGSERVIELALSEQHTAQLIVVDRQIAQPESIVWLVCEQALVDALRLFQRGKGSLGVAQREQRPCRLGQRYALPAAELRVGLARANELVLQCACLVEHFLHERRGYAGGISEFLRKIEDETIGRVGGKRKSVFRAVTLLLRLLGRLLNQPPLPTGEDGQDERSHKSDPGALCRAPIGSCERLWIPQLPLLLRALAFEPFTTLTLLALLAFRTARQVVTADA